MKRSPMKPSTKPMARGDGFKRKPEGARKAIKSTRPRMTPIRKAAHGKDCTMMITGVCNRDPATVVLCHSNSLADGKGMGLKATDTAACFGCSSCHDVLDGRRPLPGWLTRDGLLLIFDRAREITHSILRSEGLIE